MIAADTQPSEASCLRTSDVADAWDEPEDVPCGTMFATETMAELSARQGRIADAVAIYRHLVLAAASEPGGRLTDASRDEQLSRWKARLCELEATRSGPSAESPAGQSLHVPAPRAGSEAAAATRAPSSARPGTETAALPNDAVVKAAASTRKSSTTRPTVSNRCRTALVIREPVRSGQLIYADGRDLIVLAPVHSGAQLLADGHIHVYGALKGRAVAGAKGARDAQVFCLSLEAELVGVDTGYMLSDDVPAAAWGAPTRVYLSPDGVCLVARLPLGKASGAARARRSRWIF